MGVNPAPVAHNQPPDPGIVAILNRLVNAQEKQASDQNESKRFTQFPTVKFDGSSPEKSLDHWNIFMQYWIYVLGKGYVPQNTDPNYYTVFCQQFILTLTGIAYTWFKQMQDNYNDINDVKAAFLKQFNEWGQTVKQHMTAWNNLRFDVQQHDMDVFTRKLRLLASILYMTDDQTVEKFKDSFDTNIAAHLIECETLAEAREKAEQLVFLYKNTVPTTAATVLLHDNSQDPKELKEHQLAPVPKADKKGQNQRDRNKQANNYDSSRGQNPHIKGDNRDSVKQEVDLIREAVSSKAEEVNKMVKGLTIEVEASQEEAEGMITAIMAITTPIILEVEVDPFKDDLGGHAGINRMEGVIHHKREQETPSIGAYHNINTFAVYAEIKAIMTTNAIPSSTWLMQYRASKHKGITLQIMHLNMTIIMTNRLFKLGIPYP